MYRDWPPPLTSLLELVGYIHNLLNSVQHIQACMQHGIIPEPDDLIICTKYPLPRQDLPLSTLWRTLPTWLTPTKLNELRRIVWSERYVSTWRTSRVWTRLSNENGNLNWQQTETLERIRDGSGWPGTSLRRDVAWGMEKLNWAFLCDQTDGEWQGGGPGAGTGYFITFKHAWLNDGGIWAGRRGLEGA